MLSAAKMGCPYPALYVKVYTKLQRRVSEHINIKDIKSQELQTCYLKSNFGCKYSFVIKSTPIASQENNIIIVLNVMLILELYCHTI